MEPFSPNIMHSLGQKMPYTSISHSATNRSRASTDVNCAARSHVVNVPSRPKYTS